MLIGCGVLIGVLIGMFIGMLIYSNDKDFVTLTGCQTGIEFVVRKSLIKSCMQKDTHTVVTLREPIANHEGKMVTGMQVKEHHKYIVK
tara:strand:+ start:101324 stop:101587 length:264 start_codon:yes stop_codon:yes gene_type:complete